jgi:hypothetical protein
MQKAATWLLCAQLALTVAALVLAVMAMTSKLTTTSGMAVAGGVMVSTPVIICGVVLLAAGILGLVALRRPSLYLWAGIILLAPLALAAASSVPGEEETSSQVLLPQGTWQSFQQSLRLLEWSAGLMFGAVIVAALAAVLLLQLRRRHGS